MESSRNRGKAAHYAHYMQRGKTTHLLNPSPQTLDSFRLNIVLRELGDESERWHRQHRLTTFLAGIRLWKLWRHPGKGRRRADRQQIEAAGLLRLMHANICSGIDAEPTARMII
jgi:hypothetical protein